jgi:hypothetical protein
MNQALYAHMNNKRKMKKKKRRRSRSTESQPLREYRALTKQSHKNKHPISPHQLSELKERLKINSQLGEFQSNSTPTHTSFDCASPQPMVKCDLRPTNQVHAHTI